jgi:hypothetical protein
MSFRHFARPLCSLLVIPFGALGLVACGGSSLQAGGPAAPGEVTRRDIKVSHQSCAVDSSGAEKVNVGGDPRPDIIIVSSGGHEVCRSVDMNFDGTVDAWVYRDAAGNVVRRENDYDRDGRIDEIAIYQGGVLVEKQRATTLVGRLDTWHFYQGGKLARTERDSDGDSQIDQWWEYPKPDSPDCPVIHSDVDGDGHPDPGATVNVCGEASGYVPPERASDKAATGATFDKTGPGGVPTELPTETGNKPAGGTDEKKPAGATDGQKPAGATEGQKK